MPLRRSTIKNPGNFSFGKKRPAFKQRKVCETCGGSGELTDLAAKKKVACEDCRGRGEC